MMMYVMFSLQYEMWSGGLYISFNRFIKKLRLFLKRLFKFGMWNVLAAVYV